MNELNEKSIQFKERVKKLLTSMDCYSMFQMVKPGFVKSLGSDVQIIKGILDVYADPRKPVVKNNRTKLLERRINTYLKSNSLEFSDVAVATFSRKGFIDSTVMESFDFDTTTENVKVKDSLLEIKNYGPVAQISVINQENSVFNANDRCSLFFNLDLCQKIEADRVLLYKTPFGGFLVNLNPADNGSFIVMREKGLIHSLFNIFRDADLDDLSKMKFKQMFYQIAPEDIVISCFIENVNELDLENKHARDSVCRWISLLFSEKEANACVNMIELYQDATIPILKLFGKLNDAAVDNDSKELDITF